MGGELHFNIGPYARFILRRDRISLPIWLISLIATSIVIALAYTQLTPTLEDRMAIGQTMINPAVTAMFGPAWGIADYHYGAIMGHQMLLFTALIVATMTIMLTIKHTRADEENGRFELIRSLPVGRLTNLSATMLVLGGACVFLALVTGLGMAALGLEGMTLGGSLLYGAALGATGIFFAALAALCAQLSETSRGATGLSFGLLGLAYLIRGIGDVGNETLSWLSPLGWVVQTRVYVENIWWPVLLMLVAGAVIFAVALRLSSSRDIGAAIIPARPGRTRASGLLQSVFGLVVRLQSGMLIAWGATVFILGASYGSIMGELEGFVESMQMIKELLTSVEGFTLTEQFIPMLMVVMTITATIPALLMALKVRTEENHNRTEQLLSKSVSRNNVLGSYMVLSFVVATLMVVLSIVGMWSVGAAVMEDSLPFTTIFQAGITYLPALWVMCGLTAMLIGLAPQAAGLMWLYLGFAFFTLYMGPILGLPAWFGKLTPYGHIPRLPVEEANFTVYAVMVLLAAGLTWLGFYGYNHRDIQG